MYFICYTSMEGSDIEALFNITLSFSRKFKTFHGGISVKKSVDQTDRMNYA